MNLVIGVFAAVLFLIVYLADLFASTSPGQQNAASGGRLAFPLPGGPAGDAIQRQREPWRRRPFLKEYG